MAFDQATRNRLQKFVGDARKLLSEEFIRQLQNIYGLDPVTGAIAELSDLPSLSLGEQQTANMLRDTLDHYLAASHTVNPYADSALVTATLDRIVREQAFTVLNRLAALRMAEARQFVMESISQGYQSKGFQLYQRIAGSALGETGQAYQVYLFSVFDELSLDLAVLFDRYASQGRLFPRETVLLELLDLINHAELELLWAEDETIGWIYQYWNVREEIDQAREESRAPRNSREMAVRNQFFTPRYVVEFLTDNTLGKTWYEMLQGETCIASKCEYLFVNDNIEFLQESELLTEEQATQATIQYIPYRKAKDPRCLRIIDPACGSGHFLLYVFDLLISIYEEAWEKEPLDGWPIREGFAPLKATYDSLNEYRNDIPALIIANNLYGVDIDPRAIQIAGLAIWLRGQRYWNDISVKQSDRPTVRRSNLICAESLHLDNFQLEQYKCKLPLGQRSILSELLIIIAEKMSIAGEMGILLKLEKDIKTALDQVEFEYKRYQDSGIQDDLFGRAHIDAQLNLKYSVQGLNGQFFIGAEKNLMETLAGFLEASEVQSAYKNKLFVDDIAHSLAFVDLMKLRFDVIVMNPPFGKPSVDSEPYMEVNYPDSPSDVYQAFVDRGQELLVPSGFLGAITSRTGFFLGSYESWRRRVVLRRFRPLLLADLGMGVLDAMVETSAYVFRSINAYEKRMNLHQWLAELEYIEVSRKGEFSVPKYQKARTEKLSREQSIYELYALQEGGFAKRLDGNLVKYQLLPAVIKQELTKNIIALQYPKMTCIRLVNEIDKQHSLLAALKVHESDVILVTDPSSFDAIPGSPFSYWVSDKLRNTYKNNPTFKSDRRVACQGIASGDDFRYVRFHWEVKPEQITPPAPHSISVDGSYCIAGTKFETFAKGGALSPYYNDLKLVFNWIHDGQEVRLSPGGNGTPNRHHYFQSGFSWPKRTSRFSPAALPRGTIFGDRSMSAFSTTIESSSFIPLMCSSIFDTLFKLKVGRFGHPEFQAGIASLLPIPEQLIVENVDILDTFFKEGYSYAVATYLSDETSRLYQSNWYQCLGKGCLEDAALAYTKLAEKLAGKVEALQSKVDQKALGLYGLEESDLPDERLKNNWQVITGLPVEPENALVFIAKDLLSNMFGRLLGRFWSLPSNIHERDAFDPLPVPSLDPELTQLPVAEGKLKELLKQGIAPIGREFVVSVDDLLPELLRTQYPDGTGLSEDINDALNVNALSQYFSNPSAFFNYHLSQYSGSSRVAPVYLPLTSTSGNFVIWLFYQKLSRATLYSALNDVIEPTVKSLGEDYRSVKQAPSSSTNEAKLAALLDEIKDFRDNIQSILAGGYQCDIDDGVVISVAPLRKLFNHLRWREELETRWEALSTGEYEWAKLAYFYWPERVLKKCHQDRSIAIAHDVEDDLWEEVEVPAARGRRTKWVWQPKDMSEAELDAYIQQKIAKGSVAS